MPKLVAIKEIRYAGKTVMPGETFEAIDKDARVLKAIKKAADPEPTAVPPKTQKKPPPLKVDEKVAEPHPAEPTAAWPAIDPAPRRGYQRRDMKAED